MKEAEAWSLFQIDLAEKAYYYTWGSDNDK